MLSTALTPYAPTNVCHPIDLAPSNPMCPIRAEISRDLTALRHVPRGALQPRESIRTCEWFTNRLAQMQKNIEAFDAALGALTRRDDFRALKARDVQNLVLTHLISMPPDADVDLVLSEFIHDINRRPSEESVDDVCERHFGRSILRDIRQWFAHSEQVRRDHREYGKRMHFLAGLVGVGFLGRDQITAAIQAAVGALQAFRWLGTGRDPQHEIAQDNQGVPDPRANG